MNERRHLTFLAGEIGLNTLLSAPIFTAFGLCAEMQKTAGKALLPNALIFSPCNKLIQAQGSLCFADGPYLRFLIADCAPCNELSVRGLSGARSEQLLGCSLAQNSSLQEAELVQTAPWHMCQPQPAELQHYKKKKKRFLDHKANPLLN